MKLSKTKTKDIIEKAFRDFIRLDLDVDDPINRIMDYLDGHNCFSEASTVESVVNYTDREFRKKYGQDAIFCDFPLATTTVMKLAAFQGKHRIKIEDYKKYAYWLVHNPRIRKELGRQIQIWDLCNQQLFMKYEKEAPEAEELITERKRISKKRLLTV